jgi:beta-lactamase superfamily II metal-dependent hydrolase
MTVTLDVLPAAHGDALIITYGSPGAEHRILIDGGPAPTYADGLRAHLAAMDAAARHFELAIVTHIDADHIDGSLILFQDAALGLSIDDVWFNGWPQVAAADGAAAAADGDDVERGALQGEFLTRMLSTRAWNTVAKGAAVTRDLDHQIELPGGARLTILSPTPVELDILRKDWTATVTKAGFAPGDSAKIAARLQQRGRYDPPEEEPAARGEPGERGPAVSKLGSDRAPANGSSIAVLLEVEGKRLLLGGDAHAQVMVDALHGLAQRFGTSTVNVDVFKLAHHGSAGNITKELLDLLRCDRFVVSTNGAHFHHPDAEAIELLGRPGAATLPTVYFNYLSATTRPWSDAAAQQRTGIQAVFGDDGHLTVSV